MSDTTPQVRVGDRERRVVDDQLMAAVGDGVLTLTEYDERAAVLWQARTRAELDALVVDLPSSQRPVPAPVHADDSTKPRTVVAVLGEDQLDAPVLPGQAVHGWAVLGSVRLDLRRPDLPDEVRVRVRTLLGEVEVLVPPGTTVHLSGASVMAERRVKVDGAGGGPVIHLDAIAVLGEVKVSHGKGRPLPTANTSTGLSRKDAPAPAAGSDRSPAVRQRGRAGRIAAKLGSSALTLALLAGVGGVVASGTDKRVVFGSGTEIVRADQQQVAVSVLFGSVEIIVPDDVEVDTGGLVVFGSTDCQAACDGLGAGRVVQVRALGGFGSVEILTQSESRGRGGRAGRLNRVLECVARNRSDSREAECGGAGHVPWPDSRSSG
ncbi:MAG: DUF1707 SHOCT-like domain-containing protein [Mycobacteriales bacterium]